MVGINIFRTTNRKWTFRFTRIFLCFAKRGNKSMSNRNMTGYLDPYDL